MTASPLQKNLHVNKLNVLDAEVQDLLATAKRIQAGLSDVHRAARNRIADQTCEEWLRAYDGADMARQVEVS